ncbi:MAG: ATPase [Ponticaulis sp.]|nr:ATPase [Ponticaulis sp.]
MDASPVQLPKRFYKKVDVAETETGWAMQLDGRSPVTPAKQKLIVPTEALAIELAAEWDGQEGVINLPTMTLTRLANVALDRTPATRAAIVEEVCKYAGTDLVCYLVDAPSELRERQEAHFKPLRDWASRNHGIALVTTEGAINTDQPEASLLAVQAYADRLDDFALTGLVMGVGLFSSAVLGIAALEGELQATDAFDMSRIEEMWQIEQWGEDQEATEAVEAKRKDVEALGRWFTALKGAHTA